MGSCYLPVQGIATATVTSYLDIASATGAGGGPRDQEQVVSGIRTRLRAAEGRLDRVILPIRGSASVPVDPVARRYAAAVDALAAGGAAYRGGD